jgi:hypothetical protein
MYSVALGFRLAINIAGTNPPSAISGILEGRQPGGFPPASSGLLSNIVCHCIGPFMQTPDVALPGIGVQTFEAARSFERATSPGTFSATSRSPRSDGFPPIYSLYTSHRMKIVERRLILHRRTFNRSPSEDRHSHTRPRQPLLADGYADATHYGASLLNYFTEIPGFHLRWAIVPVTGPSTTVASRIAIEKVEGSSNFRQRAVDSGRK